MDYDIRDFGAVANCKTLSTKAVQKAIDAAGESGGGRVIISGGRYMIGTLKMRSRVELHLCSDGTLLGSPECADYPENELTLLTAELLPRERSGCMILAEGCDRISITGNGTIDCNGEHFVEKVPENEKYWMPYRRIDAPTPPRVVFLVGCTNVLVEDITMQNQPAGWSFWVHDCAYVAFDRVKIRANVCYPNNDGIHINCSHDVTVSNCSIACGDDCLVVRANNVSRKDPENRACERVTVTNCNLTSGSAGIRIGWMSDGTIRNCTFSNLVMTDVVCGISISLPGRGKERISDEGREDTLVERLSFSGIVMDNVRSCPIFIRIVDNINTRCNAIRNLYFRGITARGYEFPYICGRKSNIIDNVSFTDCDFTKLPLPENYSLLPGAKVFATNEFRPMVLRFVRNLRINNTAFNSEEDYSELNGNKE